MGSFRRITHRTLHSFAIRPQTCLVKFEFAGLLIPSIASTHKGGPIVKGPFVIEIRQSSSAIPVWNRENRQQQTVGVLRGATHGVGENRESGQSVLDAKTHDPTSWHLLAVHHLSEEQIVGVVDPQ